MRLVVVIVLTIVAAQPGQELRQSQAGQAVWISFGLVEVEHQVEEIDIVHRLNAGRQFAADSRHRQHGIPYLPQLRNQPRVEKRALACTGLGIEKHQPL